MRATRFLFSLLAITLCSTPPALDQHALLCDVTCGSDPSSPSYGGTYAARTASQNVREFGALLSVRAEGAPQTAPTLAGSQSAFYAITILHLPGRNGLDLDLTLYYSSRVWTIDTVNSTATFNADKDFPTYGFRLNFGFLETSAGCDYSWAEPDGTKRQLTSSGDSQDASYIHYDSASKTLRTKNGTAWVFEQVGTTTTFRPIKIQDTCGNFISIVYSTATGANNQAISTITDTLGRQITFNYDGSNRLSYITAAAYGGTGTTTIATFTRAIHPAKDIRLNDVLKDIREVRNASVGHLTKMKRTFHSANA